MGFEITCLVTSVPIEGESIEIEFHSDMMHLYDNIAFILKHGCRRLRNINMMLLQDMDVESKLSRTQYDKLLEIIGIQFPYASKNDSLNYSSPSTRILVRKMTNHREQIALRASGAMTGPDVFHTLEKFINLTSERMIETNINDTKAYDVLKAQTPEDQMILQMVMDTIYGRMQPEVTTNRLNAYAEDKQLSLPLDGEERC